ncbi:MAG: asparagine synthetase B [Candidatus Krumholzibacteria bacterium]|nr:asparagine synthetase B [Candidatus Krumholzibacteria bacterium]MDP6668818.1 asparagine synthetase B [Candidatus Krumholzibacteria bacterium]MDP7022339.1 asparagine synthetase B [Candidatus Krumholzibacteria bacterium]
MKRLLWIPLLWALPLSADLLIPMDLVQTDHLKAYGLVFHVLQEEGEAWWLLNYRGGSFLLPSSTFAKREASRMGVKLEEVRAGEKVGIFATIEENNMEKVLLEKAPEMAIYAPPTKQPWDDAVMLALEYAEIDYTLLYDGEVLRGDLSDFDWLHLHHEDFTGQYGKFYASYRREVWYRKQQRLFEKLAAEAGFPSVSEHKKAVARAIRGFVDRGGFLFAMCSATDSFDISLASEGIDIVDSPFDGNPPGIGFQEKLDFGKSLCFEDFHLIPGPMVYEFSDIDATGQAAQRGEGRDWFTLFEFSAKFDPVPCMLVQNHVSVVSGFMGQTTSYHKRFLKDHVTVMGEVEGAEEVRYLHGKSGQGTFTFLGGHDPEDYFHRVGDPSTELSLHPHSPGYRLILNNVLFPAAEKKERKT